jgi:hypothetical protein
VHAASLGMTTVNFKKRKDSARDITTFAAKKHLCWETVKNTRGKGDARFHKKFLGFRPGTRDYSKKVGGCAESSGSDGRRPENRRAA